MNAERLRELAARIEARGWHVTPISDDDLDRLQSLVADAVVAVAHELGTNYRHTDDGPRFYETRSTNGAGEALECLAGINQGLAALARLRQVIDNRRATIEAQGLSWFDHLLEIGLYRDGLRDLGPGGLEVPPTELAATRPRAKRAEQTAEAEKGTAA